MKTVSSSGGSDENFVMYDEILQYEEDSEEWTLAGHMIEARVNHAVSVVQFDDVREHCILYNI